MTDLETTAVYRPSRIKLYFFGLICAALSLLGLRMAEAGDLRGWFVFGFFMLGAVVFSLQFLPNASYLRVSAEGLELRILYRSHRYLWSDIEQFHVGRIGKNRMVCIRFAPSYRESLKMRQLATAIAGAEACLPDTYGFSAEALADHLTEWKNRHG